MISWAERSGGNPASVAKALHARSHRGRQHSARTHLVEYPQAMFSCSVLPGVYRRRGVVFNWNQCPMDRRIDPSIATGEELMMIKRSLALLAFAVLAIGPTLASAQEITLVRETAHVGGLRHSQCVAHGNVHRQDRCNDGRRRT